MNSKEDYGKILDWSVTKKDNGKTYFFAVRAEERKNKVIILANGIPAELHEGFLRFSYPVPLGDRKIEGIFLPRDVAFEIEEMEFHTEERKKERIARSDRHE